MPYKGWLGQALRSLPKILDCCCQMTLDPYLSVHAANHPLKIASYHWLGSLLKSQQPKRHKYVCRQLLIFTKKPFFLEFFLNEIDPNLQSGSCASSLVRQSKIKKKHYFTACMSKTTFTTFYAEQNQLNKLL